MQIDSIKISHPLYHYIQKGIIHENNVILLSLEDNTSQQRIEHVLSKSKKLLVYFESVASLVNDISPDFIKQMIGSPFFCGFVTHSISTFNCLKNNYACKSYYLPVGVDNQEIEKDYREPLKFLFWSSWNDIHNNNFYGRGGFYVDEIFLRLREQIDCELTIRSPVELISSQHFPQSVHNIKEYLSREDLFSLYAKNDLYFLPSAQAHFITIPEAMSFGLPIIGNHCWGFEENVQDGYNGILEPCNQEWELCRSRDSLDFDYIDKIVERLLNLDMDKLKSISRNAVDSQREFHSVRNYPRLIDDIMRDINGL